MNEEGLLCSMKLTNRKGIDGTAEAPESPEAPQNENDIAFQKDIDQANRMKYGAPQE